jgi:Cdc25 family phosphatase
MTSIASLQRLQAEALSKLLLAEQAATNPTVAVIDVRDDGIYKYQNTPLYSIHSF